MKRILFASLFLASLHLSSCSPSTRAERAHGSLQYIDPFVEHKEVPFNYLVCKGQIEDAVDAIMEQKKSDPLIFHSGLLHDMAAECITKALESNRDEDVLLGLFATAIMHDEAVLSAIEPLLLSPNPMIQLYACRVLATFDSEIANQFLYRCLQSDFLPIRLEAAFEMAQRKLPQAVEQLEALYWKSDQEVRPAIVSFFGDEGSFHAIEFLQRLLYNEDVNIRLAAILSLAAQDISEPIAQSIAAIDDPDPRIQEACAYALGNTTCILYQERLEALCDSPFEEVALAAAYSLSRRGIKEYEDLIEQMAEDENPFALNLLSSIDTDSLTQMNGKLSHDCATTALNAAFAMLGKRCKKEDLNNEDLLTAFENLFVPSQKDLVIETVMSSGRTLKCLRVVTSSHYENNFKNFAYEAGRQEKEELLSVICEKEPELFLDVAYVIFLSDYNEMVPLVTKLLENIQTDDALVLLKMGREKLGSPYIRAFCNLALFRITKDVQYRNQILDWIKKSDMNEQLLIRPPLPMGIYTEKTPLTLTLAERSLLLADCLETLARTQDEDAIDQLLYVIKSGNRQNRAVFAALLSQCAR